MTLEEKGGQYADALDARRLRARGLGGLRAHAERVRDDGVGGVIVSVGSVGGGAKINNLQSWRNTRCWWGRILRAGRLPHARGGLPAQRHRTGRRHPVPSLMAVGAAGTTAWPGRWAASPPSKRAPWASPSLCAVLDVNNNPDNPGHRHPLLRRRPRGGSPARLRLRARAAGARRGRDRQALPGPRRHRGWTRTLTFR